MAMGPEEKKKVYAIGVLAGVIGIAGLAIWQPWAGSRSSTAGSGATPATTLAAPGTSGAAPVADSGEGAPVAPSGVAGAGGAVGAAAAPQLVAVDNPRDDPFVPFYTTVPTPLPTPVPLPTATPIPPPLELPAPSDAIDETPATDLPAFPGGNSRATVLAGLPSARISRMVNAPTAPRVQAPPVTPGTTGTNNAPQRSPNKRLAGVAIGDSVRALLEVQDATTGEYRTYIVQPGQRVDAENLQVLRIERTSEGGQTRVRMIVRENGEVRTIELREGQRADLATGGAGGEGYPGGSGSSGGFPGGGFPGSGGGFPGQGGFPGSGGFPGQGGGFPGQGGGFPGNASPPGFPGGRPGFGGPIQ